MEAQIGGDYDHRISYLEGVLASGDDQLPFPDDAGNQYILFDLHLRQFGPDDGRFLIQQEFQGFHPAVHEPVQGFYVGFHAVAGSPDVLDDLLGSLGTPIIAVEGGTVEALGWNRYGGWRVGIRSHDRKRYYYYAHLRKDRPYAPGLREGDTVQAGDVIGFMGRTGYSDTENVNNIETVHLHFGLQLIFDESQKDCDNEIWIDVYDIVELLSRHRSSVRYDRERSAWTRVYPYRDLDG